MGTRRDNAKATRARLVELQLSPPPGKRVDEMLRVSESVGDHASGEEFEALIRAEKDLQEIRVILDTLAIGPLDGDTGRRLREVVEQDPLHPNGISNSPGRDSQFELLMQAVLSRAKMNPRRFDGKGLPDFHVECNGREYAVEAKRLKSLERVQEQFEKACGQIEKSGLTGFVLMDLGPAFQRGVDAIRSPMRDADFKRQVFDDLRRFFDAHIESLRRIRSGRPVRSIQAVNWFVRLSAEDGWGLDTMYFGVTLDPHHTKRHIEYLLFQDRFLRGLPGKTELSDSLSAEVRDLANAGLNLNRLLPDH